MGTYDRQMERALAQIKAKGQLVVWRKLVKTLPDVDKPWQPATETPVDENVYIVFLPVNRVGKESKNRIEKTEVQKGCLSAYMGKVNFEPSVNDVVIRNGVILRIDSIDTIAPNGENILFTIEFYE